MNWSSPLITNKKFFSPVWSQNLPLLLIIPGVNKPIQTLLNGNNPYKVTNSHKWFSNTIHTHTHRCRHTHTQSYVITNFQISNYCRFPRNLTEKETREKWVFITQLSVPLFHFLFSPSHLSVIRAASSYSTWLCLINWWSLTRLFSSHLLVHVPGQLANTANQILYVFSPTVLQTVQCCHYFTVHTAVQDKYQPSGDGLQGWT